MNTTTVTITWADGDGHDFADICTYIEYRVTVDVRYRERYSATRNVPGEGPEIDWFTVKEIESAAAYPLGLRMEAELGISHWPASMRELLVKEVNRAMHRDNERSENLILEAAAREQAAV